jgi:hypothetical protein
MPRVNLNHEDARRLGAAVIELVEDDVLWKSIVLAVNPKGLKQIDEAQLGEDLLKLICAGNLQTASAIVLRQLAEDTLREVPVDVPSEI